MKFIEQKSKTITIYLFNYVIIHCTVKRRKLWTRKTTSYSETLNKEYIERIHQMSYSSLSDNGMLQIFSFLIK